MSDTPTPYPGSLWVIAYRGYGGTPAPRIGKFLHNAKLGVGLYNGRIYDLSLASDMADFVAHQREALASGLYKQKRIDILPVYHYLDLAEQARIAVELRMARAEDRQARREAEARQESATTPEPVQSDDSAPGSYEGDDDIDDTPGPEEITDPDPALDDEEEEETPPYDEWTVADLKAEVKKRELAIPSPQPKDKDGWIAILEAHDDEEGYSQDAE